MSEQSADGISERQVSKLGFGEVLPKDTLMLLKQIGEATLDNGSKGYGMMIGMSMQPVVVSEATGKYFILTWNDIIDLAVSAGIDELE